MHYMLVLLLLLGAGTQAQASVPDGELCSGLAEVLDEAVFIGQIDVEERDEIVDRCIENFGG